MFRSVAFGLALIMAFSLHVSAESNEEARQRLQEEIASCQQRKEEKKVAILSEGSDLELMKRFRSLRLPEDTKYVILREKGGPPIYFVNYEGIHAVSILVERNDSHNFKEIRKPKTLTKKIKLRSMH